MLKIDVYVYVCRSYSMLSHLSNVCGLSLYLWAVALHWAWDIARFLFGNECTACFIFPFPFPFNGKKIIEFSIGITHTQHIPFWISFFVEMRSTKGPKNQTETHIVFRFPFCNLTQSRCIGVGIEDNDKKTAKLSQPVNYTLSHISYG